MENPWLPIKITERGCSTYIYMDIYGNLLEASIDLYTSHLCKRVALPGRYRPKQKRPNLFQTYDYCNRHQRY